MTRAATGAGSPTPAIEMHSGDTITMEADDHLFDDGAVHTMRNDGDGDLILLVLAPFGPNQPGFILMHEDTPAA